MIAHNLEDIYTQGCAGLAFRETAGFEQNAGSDLAFILPLAVRQYQRLDQDDASVQTPPFAHLSPAERNGCALLWLALSGRDLGDTPEAPMMSHHIKTLRMDRLAAEGAFGQMDFNPDVLNMLPAWVRATFTIFQFCLESTGLPDTFVEVPTKLDLESPDFDRWLKQTKSPALWHILIEDHIAALSSEAVHSILSHPACDIGTAASFVFRFGLLQDSVGKSRTDLVALYETRPDVMAAVPQMTCNALVDILFETCRRAERNSFGPVTFASRHSLSQTDQHTLLEGLGDQTACVDVHHLPIPIALLARSLTNSTLTSPYMAGCPSLPVKGGISAKDATG